MAVLFGVSLAVIVLVVMFVSWRMNEKRKDALKMFAAEQKWAYSENGYDVDYGLLVGHPFDFGKKRKVQNSLSGLWKGHDIRAFDYSCVTESRNSKGERTETTHRFTIVSMGVPADFMRMHVKPENVFNRALGSLINSDIDFEDEEFNRAFVVECEDRKFATDVLHPRMMEMLKSRSIGLEWKFEGQWLYVIDDGRMDFHEVIPALEVMKEILDLVPAFVFSERGGM